MELRASLADSLGVPLPVTLLYDAQTINQLVDFVNEQIRTAVPAAAAQGRSQQPRAATEAEEAAAARQAAAVQEPDKASELIKLLRGAPPPRPLFLAAPGVANAQSAYFAFSQFLAWSDQPIYVLEKDNDLNIYDLARQNARDILKVQPEGPYLLGGHSYGGAVAVEIAAVLESWGHDVGLVLVSPAYCFVAGWPSLLMTTCSNFSLSCCMLQRSCCDVDLILPAWLCPHVSSHACSVDC
jgi:pimeloyl-ACP methyl ester carboxylesterase